ncbi:MAG: ABC transporter permease [Phycisphaerae bacterium]
MYKLFLTIRYLFRRRIAYFAIAAVILCTAMVVIVSSVMGGFLDKIKLKARGLLGDVIVQANTARGFPLYQEFIDDIIQWPEVEAASPVIFSVGILTFKERPQVQTVMITGLRLEETYKINAFKQSLFYEKFYPGTTSFAEQQQPLLGYDQELSPRPKSDPGSLLPILPEPFRSARESAASRDIAEDDSVDTALNELLRKADLPLVPGVFDLNPGDENVGGAPPPIMDGEPRPGLIIGRDLICDRERDGKYKRYLDLARGTIAFVTILPITDNGTVDVPVKVPFRYADDSRTGIYDIDSRHIYCDFNLLQKHLMMNEAESVDGGTIPARCSQIQIKTAPGIDALKLAERLEQHYLDFLKDPRIDLDNFDRRVLANISVMTWEQSQAHFIAPVEKERMLVTILFAIISLVAAVLVLCILYMIVLQKTRDIGVIKSLGGSARGVASIFILYGAAVGIVGTLIGGTIGYFFVININEFQDFLIRVNPRFQIWDRSVYAFDEIPNTVRMSELVTIVVTGIFMTILGSLGAAIRAGTMHPVDSLRYE